MAEKTVLLQLELAFWKLRISKSNEVFNNTVLNLYAPFRDELELNEDEQSLHTDPLFSLLTYFFRDYQIGDGFTDIQDSARELDTFIQDHRKKTPVESTPQVELSENLIQLTHVVNSIARIENVYGFHNFTNVQIDYQITHKVPLSFDEFSKVKTTLLELAETHFPIVFARASHYYERATGKQTDEEIQKIVISFITNKVKNFFLTADFTDDTLEAELTLYINKGFNTQLLNQIKNYVEDQQHTENTEPIAEKNVSDSFDDWYAVARNLDLNQVFQLISQLNVRQQLILLFRFGYLDKSISTARDFYSNYQIPTSTYKIYLISGIESLISQAKYFDFETETPINVPQFLKKANTLKSKDLLRYENGELIQQTLFEIAEIIALKGRNVLELPLTHLQRKILTLLTETYLKNGYFPREEEILEVAKISNNNIRHHYRSILATLTETEVFYAYNHVTGRKKIKNDGPLYKLLHTASKGELDMSLFNPREVDVITEFLNHDGNVNPTYEMVGKRLSITFTTVEEHLENIHQKLLLRQGNSNERRTHQ